MHLIIGKVIPKRGEIREVERYCWRPRRMSDGRWLWLEPIVVIQECQVTFRDYTPFINVLASYRWKDRSWRRLATVVAERLEGKLAKHASACACNQCDRRF